MKFFDMSDSVDKNIAEIRSNDPAILSKAIDSDPVIGVQQVADLLTFLPVEQRKGAVVGFVMAMLCD